MSPQKFEYYSVRLPGLAKSKEERKRKQNQSDFTLFKENILPFFMATNFFYWVVVVILKYFCQTTC